MTLRPVKRIQPRTLLTLLACVWIVLPISYGHAYQSTLKKILVVVEGSSDLTSPAMGDGRQLEALLGHFDTDVTVKGVNEYKRSEINLFDYTFYIGFTVENRVPRLFVEDVIQTTKPVIWIHTGLINDSKRAEWRKTFGFDVIRIDSTSGFNQVVCGGWTFTKDEPITNIIDIHNRSGVRTIATLAATHRGTRSPYIIVSGHLTYVADCPFASAGPSDRYLLFAEYLHTILGEDHEESHSALIRIEDINPLDDPDKLRDIADLLSERGIPFLVGVSPFYVNPGEGLRISLSNKPEIVDALKHMVRNGGTIVMHGITHQYKGVTGADYEFWDEDANGPISEETEEGIARKIEMGIEEFTKNGLYPLVWETPHYTASFRLYRTISSYFSSAMEQRLAIENFDYSQFFPYVINRDPFGQRIYPENLGFVPLSEDKRESERAIERILSDAKTTLAVRDGFASCFFHSFLDLDLLARLVDGIQNLGYTYLDLREDVNRVKTRDRIILAGSQTYALDVQGQYIAETTFDRYGVPIRHDVSPGRLVGNITRNIRLKPSEFYTASLVEFKEHRPSTTESLFRGVKQTVENMFGSEPSWDEARVAILWNHFARGAAYNDQASLTSVFRSLNIAVDTFFTGQRLNLSAYNLVIVPFAIVDSLRPGDYDILTAYVRNGGNLITDARNYLAEELGLSFTSLHINISRVHDHLFPEEWIAWREPELVAKYEAAVVDRVFCSDLATNLPLIIGFTHGQGRVLYIATRFDPHTQQGYSRYPYLMEYVRSYFALEPIIRRDLLEVYFDPGFRHQQSVEELVGLWVRQGIRIVHAAGWHQYPKYTYDYDRLIRLAHANGILVYLWLEPPQVSLKFWLDHPAWREKNHLGEDVRPSWRYPVALTDSLCLKAMTDEYRRILEAFDWDGVNLAELYFEAGKGLNDPGNFTPMHPTARDMFLKRSGIDLSVIFDPKSLFYWKTNDAVRSAVTGFRIEQLTVVYDRLLMMIGDYRERHPGFEVMVTAMDSYTAPELREYIAVDMDEILKLRRKFGFTLQIEDPQQLWSTDPERYRIIGQRYAELLGPGVPFLLDLNILKFRLPTETTPFPTLIQTGTESFRLVQAAASGAPRISVYSESSVNAQDLALFPYSLAVGLSYKRTANGFTIESPYSLTLRLPDRIQEITVDDQDIVPMRENLFLIPAGNHNITAGIPIGHSFTTHEMQPQILSFTGNILSLAYETRTIRFTYRSDQRAIVSISREPTAITVDDIRIFPTVMKGNDCYSVFLPSGEHRVEMVTGDAFSHGIQMTSFWSTTTISLLGMAAVFSLAVMFIALKVIRHRSVSGMEGRR